MSVKVNPMRVDHLLSGCGLAVTNVLPIGATIRFVCFVGPATAKAGGVAQARDVLTRTGYPATFAWLSANDARAGYGRCAFDIAQ